MTAATPENKDLIGWMRNNNRAARAACPNLHFLDGKNQWSQIAQRFVFKWSFRFCSPRCWSSKLYYWFMNLNVLSTSAFKVAFSDPPKQINLCMYVVCWLAELLCWRECLYLKRKHPSKYQMEKFQHNRNLRLLPKKVLLSYWNFNVIWTVE